jgi:hypothetical protein
LPNPNQSRQPPDFFFRLLLDFARRIRRLETGDEGESPRARAVGVGRAVALHPLPVQALVADVERLARQAREDARPHAHRTGGAVQAGRLVLVVADPHTAR